MRLYRVQWYQHRVFIFCIAKKKRKRKIFQHATGVDHGKFVRFFFSTTVHNVGEEKKINIIREIKLDVTGFYVKRQTAKMTSEFVFFSSNLSLNRINIEKCLLLFATNTNIFTLLFKELKTDGKSFIFAVCRLTYDHVTSNLISLITMP